MAIFSGVHVWKTSIKENDVLERVRSVGPGFEQTRRLRRSNGPSLHPER